MRKLFLAASALALLAPASFGAVFTFAGNLQPEAAGSSGSGFALVTWDTVLRTMTVESTFSGLTGTTTVAHIHCCVDPPGNVGVASQPGTFPGWPTGVTSGSYGPTTFDMTLAGSYTAGFTNNFGGGTAAGAEAALLKGLMDGRAYFNVHTSFAPGGEIRDFLTQTPEPGTFGAAGAALAAVALAVRKKVRI